MPLPLPLVLPYRVGIDMKMKSGHVDDMEVTQALSPSEYSSGWYSFLLHMDWICRILGLTYMKVYRAPERCGDFVFLSFSLYASI